MKEPTLKQSAENALRRSGLDKERMAKPKKPAPNAQAKSSDRPKGG